MQSPATEPPALTQPAACLGDKNLPITPQRRQAEALRALRGTPAAERPALRQRLQDRLAFLNARLAATEPEMRALRESTDAAMASADIIPTDAAEQAFEECCQAHNDLSAKRITDKNERLQIEATLRALDDLTAEEGVRARLKGLDTALQSTRELFYDLKATVEGLVRSLQDPETPDDRRAADLVAYQDANESLARLRDDRDGWNRSAAGLRRQLNTLLGKRQREF